MKNELLGATVLILLSLLVHLTAGDESSSFEDQAALYPQRQQQPVAKSNKPKKYKCILVDDDDESLSQNGAVSYVSELQQRRLQAANLAAEKAQVDSRRIATPILTRPLSQKQHVQQPTRVLSANMNSQQYTRTSSFALPRAEELSVAGLKNKPLKQITLTRTQPETINNYQPQYVHSTTIATPPSNMKLSQEYCNMIRQYATLYNVRDVIGWVRKNCAFAKTYLPNSTCEEINMLVASCYRFFKH